MTLIFVYNANSGRLNSVLDSGHKILSPGTYNCSLCKMTHGILREKQIWTQFRNEIHLNMSFYHKDEFEKEYPDTVVSYPVVLEKNSNKLTVLIEPEVLNSLHSVEKLIQLINFKI